MMATVASAAVYTWTNASLDGSWTNPVNWNTNDNTTPGSDDDVFFSATFENPGLKVVRVSGNIIIDDMRISADTTFTGEGGPGVLRPESVSISASESIVRVEASANITVTSY